ncbi:MAG: hypothetical protein Q7R88_01220 [bacterium]|nr:hypothetical protein [bacterium]
MSRKTTVTIVVSVIVLAVIAALIYFFFFRTPEAELPIEGEFPETEEGGFEEETEEPVALPSDTRGGPILRRLTLTPIAGAVVGGRDESVRVRYLDRATGNTYEIAATGGVVRRLTNTTIPKIYEALWRKDGASVLARYLGEDNETIQTYSATLKPKAEGEGTLEGTFLPGNIREVALSPDGKELIYMREEGGRGVGVRAAFNGSGKIQMFASPLREWIPLWTTSSRIAFLTKPSAISDGMLVSVPSGGGEMEPLIRDVAGLTALPDGNLSRILFSESSGGGIILQMLDRKTNKASALQHKTLPEKCVWAKSNEDIYCGVPLTLPGGSYPDAWYQGVISFTDELWQIDAETGVGERILDISSEGGDSIDLVHPQLSPDEKFLIFTNKNDGTLWSVEFED